MKCLHFRAGVALLSVAVLEVACATPGKQAAYPDAAGCAAERATFVAATQDLSAIALPATPDAYWATLRQGAPDIRAASRRVVADSDGLATVVDKVAGGYADLKNCRLQQADTIKSSLAPGAVVPADAVKQLAIAHTAFTADLATARQAATVIDAKETVLRDSAERLVAEAPDSKLKVAQAVAAPPVALQPYTVVTPMTIYTRPATGSGRIAELRKGQRVQGPGGGPAAGWTTLSLNDGSLGYVETSAVKPVKLNPSAVQAAERARNARDANGDPVVAAALAARQVLPQHREALISMLDAAAGSVDTAFDPAIVPAPVSAADLGIAPAAIP